MNIKCLLKIVFLAAPPLLVAGCTVHPRGERAERNLARSAGRLFVHQFADRHIPPLPSHPSPDDLVRYAMMSNGELEAKYWQWRSAIELIPERGTAGTTLAIQSQTMFHEGRTALADTTLTAQNMPSMMIPWPSKLSAAARQALENARAAGLRFRAEQFALRSRVLDAYYDYALTAQLIRLEQFDAQLLQATVGETTARNRAGSGTQADYLKVQNELDISRNEIASLQAQLPSQRATLNALLDRTPDAAIPLPLELPALKPIPYTDNQLLALAARQNPELAALTHDIQSSQKGIKLAKLKYYPDFSVGVGTDLAGITQSIMGMVSVPVLRYQAIKAGIRQGEANLRAAESTRRQTSNDLAARLVADISMLRDADRQLSLYQEAILPRATQIVSITRASYETGASSLLDLLDGERSLIGIHRLVVDLNITHEKNVADIEAITAMRLIPN